MDIGVPLSLGKEICWNCACEGSTRVNSSARMYIMKLLSLVFLIRVRAMQIGFFL